MRLIEQEAATTDEAIALLLSNLGLPRDQVKVDVVRHAEEIPGPFGSPIARPARVRALVGTPEPPVVEKPKAKESTPRQGGAAGRDASAEPGQEPATLVIPTPPAPAPQAAPSAPRREARQQAAPQSAPQPVELPALAEDEDEEEEEEAAGFDDEGFDDEGEADSEETPENRGPVDPSERADVLVPRYLSKILELMDVHASVESRQEDGVVVLEVDTEDGALLVGKRGSTKEAMVYLLKKAAAKRLGGNGPAIRLEIPGGSENGSGGRSRRRRESPKP
ncbi:MAG: Jag N-terminal domain-containing protein [Candidatus Schekmanbacteria bacterium]|nr:Jag N-terminal domain-containing protein [Candidatus Schekmanbacteria bacterium]